MQLEVYWKDIKKQSAALTGVKKIKLSLFEGNSSGIGKALTAVTKAKSTNEKYLAAAKARTAINDYVTKVHKIEAKSKDLTAAQKTSMDIVEKALGKITKELNALIASAGAAGTGKERNAADDAAWFKIKNEAMAHQRLREQGAAEAQAVVKSATEAVAKLKNLSSGLFKAALQAKASQQKGDMHLNMQSFDLLARYVDEAEELQEKIDNDVMAKVVSGTSTLMRAREDFPLPDNIPKAKADPYRKASNETFRKGDIAGQKAQELARNIAKTVIQMKTAAEGAERYSMQGKDPSAYTKRIEEMKQLVATATGQLSKMDSSGRIGDGVRRLDFSKTAPPAKTKILDDRQKIVDNLRGRLNQADEQYTAVQARAKAIPSEIAAYPATKSALAEIEKQIVDNRKNFPEWRQNLEEAEKVIASLR
jgi:hypothetical protein